MTIFDVRIPGLPLVVVQSDGLDVEPIETDEFRIGVAETYDVIVQPERAEAFTLYCETIDRSGFARGDPSSARRNARRHSGAPSAAAADDEGHGHGPR